VSYRTDRRWLKPADGVSAGHLRKSNRQFYHKTVARRPLSRKNRAFESTQAACLSTTVSQTSVNWSRFQIEVCENIKAGDFAQKLIGLPILLSARVSENLRENYNLLII
jgi:hypothetical protein